MTAVTGKVHAAPATFLIVCILLVQCFVGVDLTDEMQYYYQIEGLLETGQLFSNDLYIQQLVYVLFYPVLKPYHLLFGDIGLILFGRFVYAALLLAVYEFARRQFLRAGADGAASAFAALALALAPTYHGLFAISYNTISQIGWILTTILVVFRMPVPAWVWGVTITVSGLAHPSGGVAIGLVCAAYLIANNQTVFLSRVVVCTLLLSAGMIGTIVALSGGPDELKRALSFTAGFSIGSALLHSDTLISFFLISMLVLLAGFAPAPEKAGILAVFILFVLISLCIFYLVRSGMDQIDGLQGRYRHAKDILESRIVMCIFALYALRCLQSVSGSNLPAARPLVIITLFQALVLAGTSSNGISQANGAFAIMLPLAVAGISVSGRPGSAWFFRIPAIGVALMVAILTLALPYRQGPLITLDRARSPVPMFAGLLLPTEQIRFFDQMHEQIAPRLTQPNGLLLSSTPGLYPVLSLHPRTCMIYNHSLGGPASEAALTDCLSGRDIPLVAHLRWSDIDTNSQRFQALAQQIASDRELDCKTWTVKLDVSLEGVPSNPIISVCN